MKRILWIAPTFNYYRACLFNRLAETEEVKLTVLAGAELKERGHRLHRGKEGFSSIKLKANKKNFHFHPAVFITLLRILFTERFDVVLMTVEKKNILIILFLFLLKFFLRFNLISYNHAMTASRRGKHIRFEKLVTKWLFALYDRLIFYTKQAMQWAVEQELLPSSKAFFANNTLDTKQIWNNYSFEVNTSGTKTILFIGRLMPNKNIDLLFAYYREIKKLIPSLRLIVIGDGPMSYKIKEALENDDTIVWRGAVVDENEIAEDMRQSHVVFVPGNTGLSIVHAFCYGKPYVALSSYKQHPPEIAYLVDGLNGLLLSGKIEEDRYRFASFLLDQKSYQAVCRSAFEKAKELAVENWCSQIKKALNI